MLKNKMKLYFILFVAVCVKVVESQGTETPQPSFPLQLDHSESSKNSWRASRPPIRQGVQGTRSKAWLDLPTDITPLSYTINIRPILDPDTTEMNGGAQWTAPGDVSIEIQAAAPTSQIVLHKHHTLNITQASVIVKDSAGNLIEVTNTTYDDNWNHFYTVHLAENLAVAKVYTLSMEFSAPVSASNEGLYRAIYQDDEGTEHRMALTQFESIGARQAFPCFDEPRWKTPFTISLGYKNATYNTLSNSEKKGGTVKDQKLEGWVWDHFETTVPMPTYLVAIIVSNFEFHPAPEPVFGDRPVRIYGEPRYIAPGNNKTNGGGGYAANASAHLLNFLETEYVYKYEMPKMDSVAIPNPFFDAGAMENWGLNTYRERYLLFFDGEQTWANKQRITSIISHELAHQWFGNLVTCKTWQDIWLNEGFATYAADLGVAATHPEWNEKRERLWANTQAALNRDVHVNGTQPLYSFNAPSWITYAKGGSLIRMMEGFLGYETLNRALVKYLNANAYKTTTQDQLFEYLTHEAQNKRKIPEGKTMKEIMDTWTLQAGFPLIRVSKVGSTRVNISQERFQRANTKSAELYEVPISTATPGSAPFSNHTPAIWLSKNTISESFPHDTSKWLIINPDAMAYYRVLYDEEMTQLIFNQLKVKRDAISGLSRSQLVDDYLNCATHNHISYGRALKLLNVILVNDEGIETDFVVWYTLFSRLTKAVTLFQAYNGGPNHSLGKFLVPLIEKALDSAAVGWTQAATDQGTLVVFRTKLLDWACALNSSKCIRTAQEEIQKWKDTGVNTIPVDIQPMLYCAYVAAGDLQPFNMMLTQFKASPIGTFKSHRGKLLNALSCTQNATLLDHLLNQAIDTTTPVGELQADRISVFHRVAGNPVGRPLVFPFIISNTVSVNETLGGPAEVGNVLITLARYVTTEEEYIKFAEQFESLDLFPSGSFLWLNLSITMLKNLQWVQENHKNMDDWFTANLKSSSFNF